MKIISTTLCWLVWLLFFVAPTVYNTGKAIQLSSAHIQKSEWQVTYTIILVICIIMTAVTFGLKWLFHWIILRFKDQNKKMIWTYILLPIFGFCIWFISLPIYIYGLVFFFQSHNLLFYFAFAVWSFFILVFHAPSFLIPKRETEQGAAANP
jgi:hypothetical protein